MFPFICTHSSQPCGLYAREAHVVSMPHNNRSRHITNMVCNFSKASRQACARAKKRHVKRRRVDSVIKSRSLFNKVPMQCTLARIYT